MVFQVQLKMPVITYSDPYNLVPDYLKDCLAIPIFVWALRSADEGLLQVPPITACRMVEMRERALVVVHWL